MSSKNNLYKSWSRTALIARIAELETECKSLRGSVSTAVDALNRENTEMKEWLESQERLWELQDPLGDDPGEA
jgi:hypothetical protein